MVETVHSISVSDPIVMANYFSCGMRMEISMKGIPNPIVMEEICVYQVEDSKIELELRVNGE